ncbi:MAG: hypothetical protein IIY57_02535 [Erysipelotrichaceae bacterium]|nr:hypothetical protein [Erysipelotrichaceae bacterium]
MKKIPTLFERVYENHKVVGILPNVTEGMEWVLTGEGIATVKWDGSCCAIINGELYKRYDAKKGKKPPEGAIPCCDPDPVTGHWSHWVKCDRNNPSDRWFFAAYEYSMLVNLDGLLSDATYEAVGEHFNGNPYNLKGDRLIRHGITRDNVERSFEGIKHYLETHKHEGIVFWRNGQPQCKIKRTDFGFPWPIKEVKNDA